MASKRRATYQSPFDEPSSSPQATVRFANASNTPYAPTDLGHYPRPKGQTAFPSPATSSSRANEAARPRSTTTSNVFNEEHALSFGPSTCQRRIEVRFRDIDKPGKNETVLSAFPIDERLFRVCCNAAVMTKTASKIITHVVEGPGRIEHYVDSIVRWMQSIEKSCKSTASGLVYWYKPYRLSAMTGFRQAAHLLCAASLLRARQIEKNVVRMLRALEISNAEIPRLVRDYDLRNVAVVIAIDKLASQFISLVRQWMIGRAARGMLEQVKALLQACENAREGFEAVFWRQVRKEGDESVRAEIPKLDKDGRQVKEPTTPPSWALPYPSLTSASSVKWEGPSAAVLQSHKMPEVRIIGTPAKSEIPKRRISRERVRPVTAEQLPPQSRQHSLQTSSQPRPQQGAQQQGFQQYQPWPADFQSSQPRSQRFEQQQFPQALSGETQQSQPQEKPPEVKLRDLASVFLPTKVRIPKQQKPIVHETSTKAKVTRNEVRRGSDGKMYVVRPMSSGRSGGRIGAKTVWRVVEAKMGKSELEE